YRPPDTPDLHSFPTRRSSDLGRIELPGPCPHIAGVVERGHIEHLRQPGSQLPGHREIGLPERAGARLAAAGARVEAVRRDRELVDRKSTRLNSSHDQISYAVF